MSVRIGTHAPHFDVDAWVRGADSPTRVTLEDFKDDFLVLFFYSRDFGDICPDELAAFARLTEQFADSGVNLLGASTDSFQAHKAWFASEPRLQGVRFPVIADSAHKVSEVYGTLMQDGAAARATFVIDPDGNVVHIEMNIPAVGRNVDETLRIVQSLLNGVPRGAMTRPTPATRTERNEWLAKALPNISSVLLTEATGRLMPYSFRAGETVFAQGDAPDRFYIVTQGKAEVSRKNADGKVQLVATLGPGEFFGEMGLVTATKRMATVRAKTDLECVALDWDYVVQLIESSESAAQAFAGTVRGRVNK